MTQARIENGKAHCPFCDSTKFEVFRRSPAEDGNVACIARCKRCDDTFSVLIDRYGEPLQLSEPDPDCPDLPFEKEG